MDPMGNSARSDARSMFSSATTQEMQEHILSMMLGAREATTVEAMEAFGDPEIWKEDVFTLPVLGLFADTARPNLEYMKTRFPKLEFHKIPGSVVGAALK